MEHQGCFHHRLKCSGDISSIWGVLDCWALGQLGDDDVHEASTGWEDLWNVASLKKLGEKIPRSML